MGISLACSTVPYEAVPLERALSGIAAAGFKNAVVGPAHEEKPVLDLAAGAEGGSSLRAALEEAGVGVGAIWPELEPLDQPTADAFGIILEQAKALGAGEVWVSGPPAFDESGETLRPDDEWERDLEAFAEHVKGLAAIARELGVGLAVPTEPRLSGCGAEAEKLFALVGDESGLTLAYNPGLVSYFTGVNPLRDLEILAPLVSTLCVRNHSGAVGEANFPPVGGGDIDYIELLGALKGLGFSGNVVVEHLPGATPEELDGSAKSAFRFLDMLLKQL